MIVEATAVSPEGRISPADSGIYSDAHIEPFAKLASDLSDSGSKANGGLIGPIARTDLSPELLKEIGQPKGKKQDTSH